MKAENVRVYICPKCDEQYTEKGEAQQCCLNEVDKLSCWKCTNCFSTYQLKKDADRCCLNKFSEG